jgi:hypothetical protein
VRLAAEEPDREDDESWCAEAALERSVLVECPLDGMEDIVPGEVLDRLDLATARLHGKDETRANRRAVEEHGARAADAVLAPEVGPREPVVTQRVSERLPRQRGECHRLAVYDELDVGGLVRIEPAHLRVRQSLDTGSRRQLAYHLTSDNRAEEPVVAVDTASFQSFLLDLLARIPEDAESIAGREILGESRLLVDGELLAAERGRVFPVVSPVTGEAIGEAADATVNDLERAIAASRRAFDESMWATDPALRARCLRQLQDSMRRHREEYRRALVAEIGCAVRMTYGDQLDRPIEKLGFYADLAEKYEYVVQVEGESGSRGDKHIFREPVGVVGAITPWNIPVELNLAKVGAALAAGCTVVLKPSPESPWSARSWAGSPPRRRTCRRACSMSCRLPTTCSGRGWPPTRESTRSPLQARPQRARR